MHSLVCNSIHIHVHIHTYINIHTHTHKQTYIHIHTHTCRSNHLQTVALKGTPKDRLCIYIYIHAHTYMQIKSSANSRADRYAEKSSIEKNFHKLRKDAQCARTVRGTALKEIFRTEELKAAEYDLILKARS
jgi:hypothetical protein